MTTISFSGVGSGLDYASWAEQLVAVKQEPVTDMKTQKTSLETENNVLNSLKSNFSSLLSKLSSVSDSILTNSWVSKGKNDIDVSDKTRLTATTTESLTPEGVYNNAANKIATSTNFFVKTDSMGDNTTSDTKISDVFGDSTGSFKINGTQIQVTEDMTFGELADAISDSEAGVEVNFKNGQLNFKSETTGEKYIGLSDDTTGLLSKFGLVDESGHEVQDKQSLGTKASISINDKTFTSDTNTFDQSITNIPGLEINTIKATVIGSTVTVTVKADTENINESIKSSIKDVVSAYNTAVSAARTQTDEDGYLQYDNQINSLVSNLRGSTVASTGTKSEYSTLASIGISTGSAGASIDADTVSLQLDETKLQKALEEDPDSVVNLIAKLQKSMSEVVKPAVDSTYGLFVSKVSANESKITRLDDKIERENTNIDAYEAMITKQFQNMDSMIAKMQNAYNSSSLFSS